MRHVKSVGHGRYANYGKWGVAEEEEEVEEEQEEEDDEDDPEFMQLTEESSLRDLALGDWARADIGWLFWFSPADIWSQYSVLGQSAFVPDMHSCP